MKNIEIATKQDLTVIEQQSEEAVAKSDFKVTSQETLKQANEVMDLLKLSKKSIAEKKATIIVPIKLALKGTTELFKPMEDNIKVAVEYLKEEILTYKDKVDRAIRKQQLEVIKQKESGELTLKEAFDKVNKIEEKTSEFKTRKNRGIEIVDEKKIPKEYWVIDMVLLRKEALAGKEIPGVKVVEIERATM